MRARTSIALVAAPSVLCAACGGRTPLYTLAGGALPGDAGLLATSDTSPSATQNGGLLPPTPGRVRCGAIVCAEGYECCIRYGEGNPASIGCDWRSNAGCPMWPRTCDETADCGPGELCCWFGSYSPPPTWASICHNAGPGRIATSCPAGPVGCSNDADCNAVGAPRCVAQRCRGDIIQTCGLLPDPTCGPP